MQDDKAIGKIKPIPCDNCPFWQGMIETLIIPCPQCKHRTEVSSAEMLLRATNPWLWKRVQNPQRMIPKHKFSRSHEWREGALTLSRCCFHGIFKMSADR